MTKKLVFVVPGDLGQLTGGYAYDRRMIQELRLAGWAVEVLQLPGRYPFPEVDDLAAAAQAFAALAAETLVLVDGLAFGAMPGVAEAEADRLRLVALVHHPLALETGLDAVAAGELSADETRALAAARRIIATSRTTARTLAEKFAVSRDRLLVAPPGTDSGPVSRGQGAPPLILSVGTLIPRKGHDILVEALARITDLDWDCRILGSHDRNSEFSAKLRCMIAEHDLTSRIALLGEAADVRVEMAAADLFVLATRHEGYGMVFAEAMSQGLPIVGCTVGAVPEVVPEEAGLLVAPDDASAVAAALRRLLTDPELRRSKAAGALAAGSRLPSWRESSRRLAQALEEAST